MPHLRPQPAKVRHRDRRIPNSRCERRSIGHTPNRNGSIQPIHRRTQPARSRRMQHHQQSLANPVAICIAGPQPGPLPQDIRPASAAANGLIHLEINLDKPRPHAIAVMGSYRNHLSNKDDIRSVRHLVQNIFHVLGYRYPARAGRDGSLRISGNCHRQTSHRRQATQPSKYPKSPQHLATPSSALLRQKTSNVTVVPYFNTSEPQRAQRLAYRSLRTCQKALKVSSKTQNNVISTATTSKHVISTGA